MSFSSNNSQMHNDIMPAGSKERLPMLTSGSYAQWKSRFMRYVDTKPNKDLLKKTIYDGRYIMTEISHPKIPKDTKGLRMIYTLLLMHVQMQKRYGLLLNVCNKESPSTFKMSRQSCSGNLANLLHERGNQLSHTTQEWSRFVTIVKQAQDLDTACYHKLFDILKQHQNEVNKICVERMARNANPLALVDVSQHYLDGNT
ncbi:hypothetical protein Tco_1282296 [Tanacetum coccineum]